MSRLNTLLLNLDMIIIIIFFYEIMTRQIQCKKHRYMKRRCYSGYVSHGQLRQCWVAFGEFIPESKRGFCKTFLQVVILVEQISCQVVPTDYFALEGFITSFTYWFVVTVCCPSSSVR